MTDDITDMTPSTRDLMQYVSPNPTATETLYLIKETSTKDLNKYENDFEKWEEQNICAVIIDTNNCPSLADSAYLKTALEKLECPLLRLQNIKNEEDVFHTRALGFHGLVTPVTNLTQESFHALYRQAESVNFRLIPAIKNRQDCENILSSNPKFIYLDNGFNEKLPEPIIQSHSWLMGKIEMKTGYNLKCLIEEKSNG